jgi:hypothetical protein
MSRRNRGMSEYQVRTRLYDPPEAVRRIDSKLACWKLTAGPRIRGEDVRRAFERRLEQREPVVAAAPAPTAEVVAAPTQSAAAHPVDPPSMRLIA